MNEKREQGSVEESRRAEAPSPTIVGPRPETSSGQTISVPRGMERLLTLAGLNEDWKRKTLTDPLKTAVEADIALSDSESAILRSITPQTLGQMIASFARNRFMPIRDAALAAGTAAAALLASTGCDQFLFPAATGIRTDEPKPWEQSQRSVRQKIQWEPSIETALQRAVISNQAVMVVCSKGGDMTFKHAGPPGSRGISIELPSSPFLTKLCENGNDAVAAAVFAAGQIAVKLPADEDLRAYITTLRQYEVVDIAPLVFFLAPDGTMLSQLIQPANEEKLVQAIQAVPPLLADWIVKQRKPPTPITPISKGITPE